ncbi:MAG: hypothetical protein LQ346_005271 [Caloplaca aetnensis]|nr:MAG: hypothetical protein LQ346_005271 [Caloplaca aetnensis]
MSKQAMNPSIKLDEQSTVGYESADEIDASKYQVAWANVMEEGRYLSLSVYERGEVLILCWKEHCSDVDTRTEVEHLVNVLETEDILRPAGADVLEIFDCCYAGTLGLTRGENRLFEYLAAAKDQGTTALPGPKSFTSALTFALEALKNEKHESRFTTDELLRKIKTEAPHFPKDQTPILSDREHKKPTGGRIMLHPIRKDRVDSDKASKVPPMDQGNGHIVTLHFDFGDKPSEDDMTTLGQGLNEIFERSTLRVHRVRWGGLRRTMFGLVARRLRGSLRKRRASQIGRSTAHPRLLAARSSPAVPRQDWDLLSPQAAEFDSPDFVATGSSNSPVASSAPTSDIEREPEISKEVAVKLCKSVERLEIGGGHHREGAP